jgi:hypothetical protein
VVFWNGNFEQFVPLLTSQWDMIKFWNRDDRDAAANTWQGRIAVLDLREANEDTPDDCRDDDVKLQAYRDTRIVEYASVADYFKTVWTEM